eukprot:12408422-Alexandrium_andersonii.AAC.1
MRSSDDLQLLAEDRVEAVEQVAIEAPRTPRMGQGALQHLDRCSSVAAAQVANGARAANNRSKAVELYGGHVEAGIVAVHS